MAGKYFENHVVNLMNVFSKFRGSGLKMNTQNCQLFHEEVKYLDLLPWSLYPLPKMRPKNRRYGQTANYVDRSIFREREVSDSFLPHKKSLPKHPISSFPLLNTDSSNVMLELLMFVRRFLLGTDLIQQAISSGFGQKRNIPLSEELPL